MKNVSLGKAGGKFVSLQELQSVAWAKLTEFGHIVTKDESIPTTAFIVLARKALRYTVVFTIPSQDSERTFANKCMDHYHRGEYRPLAELIIPLLLPIYKEADNNPISEDSFEAFLQASDSFFRLVSDNKTSRLEPYPEFVRTRSIDWEVVMRRNAPDCPLWELSDVKHFRPHSHTNMIHEVDLGDNTDFRSVILKRFNDYHSLYEEYKALMHCGDVGIRAPRALGLVGVGTRWGGFFMTRISSPFCLEDWYADAWLGQSTLCNRKRWYEQVSNAIHTLHRAGCVSGDAKPVNVLIDKEGNACLVDFEGGYQPGWIDTDLADTKEGDLQGLAKLHDFFKLDE
ncbi:hypothetical protein BJX62DRAFT_236545 [Aspergillus germanicus]